tara:strand:+ start:1123 stop:1527 length:405 start_codon:yes stop_codon:yes gene_type:complete
VGADAGVLVGPAALDKTTSSADVPENEDGADEEDDLGCGSDADLNSFSFFDDFKELVDTTLLEGKRGTVSLDPFSLLMLWTHPVPSPCSPSLVTWMGDGVWETVSAVESATSLMMAGCTRATTARFRNALYAEI